MEKAWEKKAFFVLGLLMALAFLHWRSHQAPNLSEGYFIFTRPEGARILMPEARSIYGAQLKEIAIAPGPIPVALSENSRFTFVLQLPGYQPETVRVTQEELQQNSLVVPLRPKLVLAPLFYLLRDYRYLLVAGFLLLWFFHRVARPQIRERRRQAALWADGVLKPGLRIHDYQLESVLGEGGAGVVFLASRVGSDKQKYAFKSLHPRGKSATELRQEMERECKACSAFEHPGIVKLFDWGEFNGLCYVVSEYIDGVPLDEVRGAEPALVCEWGKQLVHALQYAHRKGVVHRDLKPANVLVDKNELCRIVDFGISARIEETEVGAAGTPGFMAPEQVNNVVHPASDYYSLGVTLYCLLAGSNPFKGDDFFQVLASQAEGRYLPLARSRPDLSPEFAHLVEALLEPDLEKRLQDPELVLARLADCSAALSSSAD